MIKIVVFVTLFCFILVSAQANKRPMLTEQEALKEMAIEANTIFKGRVLKHVVISNGLVFEDGETLDMAVIEFEVLKSYRGETHKHDRQLVCSWLMRGVDNYYGQEIGYSIGQELTVFGLRVDDNHVLETSAHGSITVIDKESMLYKVLKFKHKKITNPFAWVWPDSKIKRNACIEPVSW
jgi:predicted thioredoxin/glutaredoxin